MNSYEKIQKLNLHSQNLRIALKEIGELYDKDGDIQNCIFKINKQLSLIYQKTCLNLEKEITNEDFQKIIKTIEKELGDSK